MTVRLIDHLKALGHTPRGAREAMHTGKVWYRGVPTADAGRLVEPEAVRVDVSSPRVTMGRDPIILWMDDHLAVVWKPPGLLSVAAPGRHEEATVVGAIARRLGRGFAVHRLDEGTSGLMLVARSESARDALKAQFEVHTVERRYLALVAGRFPEAPRTVRTNFIRDRGDGLRGSIEVIRARREAEELDARRKGKPVPDRGFVRGGDPERQEQRPAVTHLRLVRYVGDVSLVEATLETGRTHQVRIHLSEAGHAVLGDPLYAPVAVGRRLPRLGLHAAVLGFQHPVDGRAQRFEAPLADDLEQWVRDHEQSLTAAAAATPRRRGGRTPSS